MSLATSLSSDTQPNAQTAGGRRRNPEKRGKNPFCRDFEAFARRKLSASQRPKLVETRTTDLPRNFLGKVLRRELRQPVSPPAVAAQ